MPEVLGDAGYHTMLTGKWRVRFFGENLCAANLSGIWAIKTTRCLLRQFEI